MTTQKLPGGIPCRPVSRAWRREELGMGWIIAGPWVNEGFLTPWVNEGHVLTSHLVYCSAMWRKRITFCSVHNLSSTLSKLPYCHTLREEHATALMYSRVRVLDSGYLSVGPSFEKISISPSCPAVHRRMHKVIYTRQTGDGNKHNRQNVKIPLCRSCNLSRNGVSDFFATSPRILLNRRRL